MDKGGDEVEVAVARGRGSGSTTTNSYSFGVILLNPEQTSIPRGSNRAELERSGRMKRYQEEHQLLPHSGN